MKINLDSLEPKKSQDFLNYFIAKLKEKNKTPFIGAASGGYNEKGQFETRIQDILKTNSGKDFSIEWKILQNNDGTIPFIEVISLTGDNPKECSEAINTFINDVLLNALANTKKEFFHRSYYCYLSSNRLSGEFWLSSKVRIAPLYLDDKSSQPIAERIIVIDQTINAIDLFHSRQLGEERAIQIAAQLSFLLDIGLYFPKREERWFVYKDPNTNENKNIRQLTGIIDPNIPSNMPKKREICDLSRPAESIYNLERYTFDGLSFPTETRIILHALENTETKNNLAFNRSCRLYQTALTIGSDYPTIKLAYLYSSIDSICKITGLFKGFSDFIIKFNPKVDRSILDLIHEKIRSAHWHTGLFYLGEDEPRSKEFILDRNNLIRYNLIHASHDIIRHAILNWIFQDIIKSKNST